ncbi:UNVERIFIED_ORG: hypothetical protein M2328_002730 [Rhodococcus erythropolis]
MPQHTSTQIEGGIRRGPRTTDNFTILRNAVVNDSRLSFRSRGVLIWLLSKPADWRTRSESIAAQSPKEGRDAIRTAMRELEALGYLVREKAQNEHGHWSTFSTVYEEPIEPEQSSTVAPGPVKTTAGNAVTGKPGVLPSNDLQGLKTNHHNAPDPVVELASAESETVVEVSPSQNTNNADRAAIEPLATACRDHGLTATFAHLKAPQIATIASLIETHGVAKLADHVRALHNPSNPTRFASGWIPMWQELRAPRSSSPAPSWTSCGHCDANGWIETSDGVARCQCHPRATGGVR